MNQQASGNHMNQQTSGNHLIFLFPLIFDK